MIKDNFTVSVAIPAYNEEKNIGHLLYALLKQRADNYFLKEIVVASDMSDDKTDEIVKEIKDDHIKFIRNNVRMGAAMTQNILMKACSGDVILMLNADVLPDSDFFIETMVQQFINNPKIGIISPNIEPLPSQTFFEKVINASVDLKNNAYRQWKDGNNLYGCHGRCRAFHKSIAKKIIWPSSINEDAYSYLFCLQEGYEFRLASNATIYFRSPATFSDHVKQSLRFIGSAHEMKKYFSPGLILREYALPRHLLLKSAFQSLLYHPILLLTYCMVYGVIHFYPHKERYVNSIWAPSASSKALIVPKAQKNI